MSRQSIGISEHDIIIGTVSRLDPIKGIGYMLEAFASIVKKNHHVYLLIIGDGKYKTRLKKQSEDLQIQNKVKFVGFQANISDWLEIMDIYVLASLMENHSIALLEAMRASKAIVVTDVGGNKESISHMINGLVVPPKNSQALEREMIRLIMDSLLRKRLGMNARKRFEEKFTESQMLQGIADWLIGCKRLVQVHNSSFK
jgi:glycosyltransferase involved in cell wall biosynthesis